MLMKKPKARRFKPKEVAPGRLTAMGDLLWKRMQEQRLKEEQEAREKEKQVEESNATKPETNGTDPEPEQSPVAMNGVSSEHDEQKEKEQAQQQEEEEAAQEQQEEESVGELKLEEMEDELEQLNCKKHQLFLLLKKVLAEDEKKKKEVEEERRKEEARRAEEEKQAAAAAALEYGWESRTQEGRPCSPTPPPANPNTSGLLGHHPSLLHHHQPNRSEHLASSHSGQFYNPYQHNQMMQSNPYNHEKPSHLSDITPQQLLQLQQQQQRLLHSHGGRTPLVPLPPMLNPHLAAQHAQLNPHLAAQLLQHHHQQQLQQQLRLSGGLMNRFAPHHSTLAHHSPRLLAQQTLLPSPGASNAGRGHPPSSRKRNYYA